MKITEIAIDRGTTVLVLLILIIIAGVYSYQSLPRESNPEIIVPFVSVVTTYEGVSPADMETLVTMPIERKLTGLDDLKQIRSESVEGVSSIVIEFMADGDIDDAIQQVRDKVDLAKPDIPAEADDPIISEVNLGELPIMFLSLSGPIGLAALTEIAEDLAEDIETVPGVLDANVIGDLEREIQLIADPARVATYNIPLIQLVEIIQQENVNTPSGSMDLGEAKYSMRVPGEFQTVGDMTGLVAKQGPDGAVYMRDIGEVRDGFKEQTSKSRLDGNPNITITVSKRSGENIVEMAAQVREILNRYRAELPDEISLVATYDESDTVRDMVMELESSILTGLILVVVVIFVFMGLANAFFVALAIPLSMLIVFTVLYASGITLNMVVLFSLTLALGMLVDNGIVVVENIYRYVETGMNRVEAAKKGAAEVALPITASTITTVAAFSPMLFWPGIWGGFMGYLPKTVIASLLASLFVGLIVNPTLASRFMGASKKTPKDAPPRSIGPEEAVPQNRIVKMYARFLHLALHWRIVTVTAAVMILVTVIQVFMAAGQVRQPDGTTKFEESQVMEFVPEVEPYQAKVNIKLPPGSNLETSDDYVRRVEERLQPVTEDIEYLISNVGSQGATIFFGGSEDMANESVVTLDFPRLADAEVLPSKIVEEIRGDFADIAGAEIRVEKEDNSGPPTDPPVNVEISGDDYEVLASISEEVMRRIKDVEGLVDLRSDYDVGRPEVQVVVDRQEAYELGLSTAYIGTAVKTAVNGIIAGKYRDGEDEYDVVLKYPDYFREDLTNLEDMYITNPRGEPIPFSAVARLEEGQGLGAITRIDRKRTITVSADVEGRTGQQVLGDVQNILADYPLPSGYTFAYTGENEDTEETQEFLGQAFVVALFLIALVLITQFNSILQPLIIMSSVILSLAGVFLGLTLFNMPFGVLMTGIGCISLAGVVVNNAIVLIDFINQLRARGLDVETAIVNAAMIRFRPVMLTAVTTILGLIPMASGISFNFRTFEFIVGGESSQWWGSMAIAVIFGLAFATVLTLVVVPTLYSIMASASMLMARREPQAAPAEPAPAK